MSSGGLKDMYRIGKESNIPLVTLFNRRGKVNLGF